MNKKNVERYRFKVKIFIYNTQGVSFSVISNNLSHEKWKYLNLFPLVGRGKHFTPEKRVLIQNLIKSGKTYKGVEKLVGCSSTMIRNAIVFKKPNEIRGPKEILSEKIIRKLIRCSKNGQTMSANEIQDELNLPCGVHTVKRKLREHNFFPGSSR